MDSAVFVIGRDELPRSVSLGAGESLHWTFAVLPGTDCDLHLDVTLDGPGAEADIAGLYLCRASERVNIEIRLCHKSGGCTSRQTFKGIVGGSARAVFDGLIRVDPGAQKTSAAQQVHSVLLSAEAVAEARPQLEIYADDVECSHGATTGYLDPAQLFYLRSRGIPEQEARALQMRAFIAPVLSRLPEDIQEEILASL